MNPFTEYLKYYANKESIKADNFYQNQTLYFSNYTDSGLNLDIVELSALNRYGNINLNNMSQYVDWLEEIKNYFNPEHSLGYRLILPSTKPEVTYLYKIRFTEEDLLSLNFFMEKAFNLTNYNQKEINFIGASDIIDENNFNIYDFEILTFF